MRAKNEGTIYYDEAADRWRGQLDVTPEGAAKRRRLKVTGRTRKEAAAKLQRRREEHEAGIVAPSTMTVADLLTKWLDAVCPTTSTRNADYLRWTASHSVDLLGSTRLADLRIGHVEDALAELPDKGLNVTSIRRVRGTLSRALDWGQDRDLVARNAAQRAELPKAREAAKGRALTVAELDNLMAATDEHRLAALWRTMAGCGLRPAEALGLRWQDLDLDTATLHVSQALKWRNGEPYIGELKTARSRRTLAIPAATVAALRAHRKQSLSERLALRWPDQWRDLVFLSEAGTPLEPVNLGRKTRRIAKAAGIGHVRPYDLRHTFASMLADRGARLEDVADALGHEGTDMARGVYVHRLTDRIDLGIDPFGEASGQ